jgi:hypothetical protein
MLTIAMDTIMHSNSFRENREVTGGFGLIREIFLKVIF